MFVTSMWPCLPGLEKKPKSRREQRKRKEDGAEKGHGADFVFEDQMLSHGHLGSLEPTRDSSGTVYTLDGTLDGLGKSGINPPKLLLEQMWKLRPKETKELIVYFGRGILQWGSLMGSEIYQPSSPFNIEEYGGLQRS